MKRTKRNYEICPSSQKPLNPRKSYSTNPSIDMQKIQTQLDLMSILNCQTKLIYTANRNIVSINIITTQTNHRKLLISFPKSSLCRTCAQGNNLQGSTDQEISNRVIVLGKTKQFHHWIFITDFL